MEQGEGLGCVRTHVRIQDLTEGETRQRWPGG